jgi:adenosylcobinamide-GDP ribazoletransferase
VQSLGEALPTLLLLLGLSSLWGWWQGNWWLALVALVAGAAIAVLTGDYFYYRLGGQTGDTYGAIVEWTEALLLCALTVLD